MHTKKATANHISRWWNRVRKKISGLMLLDMTGSIVCWMTGITGSESGGGNANGTRDVFRALLAGSRFAIQRCPGGDMSV